MKQKTFKAAIAGLTLLLMVPFTPAVGQSTAVGILDLVRQGDFDGARAALAETPHSDIDELFLEAQIFTAQGSPGDAVTIYRAILAVQPDLIEIRQVLAQTLFQMGDFEAARFHFRTLLETDRRDGLRQQYANALRQIQQNIPSGFGASFAIVPSSNINRGTTNTVILAGDPNSGTISQSGRETSGVGFQLGVNGFLRIPRAEGGLFTLTASATQVLYSESVFNVFQPSLSARFENASESGIWSWEAFARRTFRRDLVQPSNIVGVPDTVSNSSANTFGLVFSGRRALSGPNILTYSALVQQTTFDTLDTQSGPSATFKLGVQRNINPSTSINGGITVGRGLPKDDAFKFRSAAVNVGVSKNWTGGWATFAGAEVGLRWFDADFGFTQMERNDRYMTVTASVLNSTYSWQGFSPRVTCNWQTTSSNIGFYDFDAYECNILMTKDF